MSPSLSQPSLSVNAFEHHIFSRSWQSSFRANQTYIGPREHRWHGHSLLPEDSLGVLVQVVRIGTQSSYGWRLWCRYRVRPLLNRKNNKNRQEVFQLYDSGFVRQDVTRCLQLYLWLDEARSFRQMFRNQSRYEERSLKLRAEVPNQSSEDEIKLFRNWPIIKRLHIANYGNLQWRETQKNQKKW